MTDNSVFFETYPAVRQSVVQGPPGYNSWPMVQALGESLVCAYSRGSAHTIDEGARGVFARVSRDGGRSWSSEICVTNDPSAGEVTIGKGLDESGAMLLWVRRWSVNPALRGHDLYRTTDGVSFAKIAAPDFSPMPMQVTDIFPVPGIGLMSLWFAGDYRVERGHAWGTLTSTDNGRTWKQRTVEADLDKADWPTEICAAPLGGGRILAIGRSENGGPQFQLTSVDGGTTWRRVHTNIADVSQSTPSLIFDPRTGLVANYHYERGARRMKRRVAPVADVFDHSVAWPDSDVLALGHEERPYDAGNVNATSLGGFHYLATYTGTSRDTAVVMLFAPSPFG